MSKNHEQPNNSGKEPTTRQAQKQTSALLFDDIKKPAASPEINKQQAITTVSLNVESLDARLPIVTPVLHNNIESKIHDHGTTGLKKLQLHYLEANQALNKQALDDAHTANQILKETKATQLAIVKTLESATQQNQQATDQMATIEAGLGKCERLLRESTFIKHEIEKIHTKLETQQDVPVLEEKMSEINSLIQTLENSKENIKQTELEISKIAQDSETKRAEIENELLSCSTLRQKIETAHTPLQEDIDKSKALIQEMTSQALDFIKSSEESLNKSKEKQTSYIAVSRDINLLRKDIEEQKRKTAYLSLDIESANKAIALNKTAVESLTNDMLNIKSNLRLAKKSTLISNNESGPEVSEPFEGVATTEDLKKLLDDTRTAHKRVTQLLDLNNSINDRMTKIDRSVSSNLADQQALSQEQREALKNIQDQRETCKRLIEQASRSHNLIVSTCKKTSALAEQIEETTMAEQHHRQAILAALKDGRSQKKSLSELQQQLELTHQRQLESLTELENAQKALAEQEQQNHSQLELLTAGTTTITRLTPQLEAHSKEVSVMVNELRKALQQNNEKSEALRDLQSTISSTFAQHKQEQQNLQKNILTQLEDHATATKDINEQQLRLNSLETDFSQHISHMNELSKDIQQKMQDLARQHSLNDSLAKDIDFSKTELRYLKEQCDQLLKECIEQSRVGKKQELITSKSIETLAKIEKAVSESISVQKQQEEGLDQLNALVSSALNDLNAKFDQFQQIAQQTQYQQKNTEALQGTIESARTEQSRLHKQIEQALGQIRGHLQEVIGKEDKITSLEQTLIVQGQKQAASLQDQHKQIQEQNKVIETQHKLLKDVDDTHQKTQKAIETIEEIRLKAQQSFAHLGAQKTKFDQAFAQSFQKLQHQEAQQQKQEQLMKDAESLLEKLSASNEKTNAFTLWQKDVTQSINEKIAKIDDYQSRAFQAQQSAQAREKELEAQCNECQHRLEHLQSLMESLDATRVEEAQYRDELRALVHQQEQQQKAVDAQLEVSQEQHMQLSRSLEDAQLMFRENKLATKETQMANRETKLILQEIRRELAGMRESGSISPKNKGQTESEKRIEALESQLTRSESSEEEQSAEEQKPTRYKPSSFML